MPPTTTTGPTPQQQQALLASANSLAPNQQTQLAELNKQFGTPEPIDITSQPEPFNIPQAAPSRAPSLAASYQPIIEGFKQQRDQLQSQISSDRQLEQQILQQLSPEALTAQFRQFEAEQVQPLIQQYNRSLQKLEGIRSAYEAQRIREEQAPGGTATGALSRVNQINVNEARESAPIIATLQMQQGQISDARQTVRDMFDIQREALGTQLNSIQNFIALNEDKLTTAQRNQLDVALQAAQQQYNEEVAALEDQQAGAEYITGLVPRMDQNAIADAQRDIANGISYQQALAKYGQFEAGLTAQEQADLNLTNARINEIRNTVSPQPFTSVTVPEGFDFGDPDAVNQLPVSDLTKAVMNGILRTKDLTPSDKAAVAAELNKVGFDPDSYLIPKLASLADLYQKMEKDKRGLINAAISPFATYQDPNVAAFNSAREILTRELARLNDVGVLSDADNAAYKKAMPSRYDKNIDVVMSKIDGLLGAQGVSAFGEETTQIQPQVYQYQTPSGLNYSITY